MSCCISIYSNTGPLFVASDSRRSLCANGEFRRLGDDGQKLHVVHSRLIFSAGIEAVGAAVIFEFAHQDNDTIEALQGIARSKVKAFCQGNNIADPANAFICNLAIFYYDNTRNAPVCCSMNSNDDFAVMFWYDGARVEGMATSEVGHFIEQNINTMPLEQLFLQAYESVACEAVGGFMTVFQVDRRGIALIDHRLIKDKTEPKTFNEKLYVPLGASLAAWRNSGYATYINQNGVYSGSFNGGMFNVNPGSDPVLESGITIGGWYSNGWHGNALTVKFFAEAGHGPGTEVWSGGGCGLYIDCTTYFRGIVDYTDADVRGLSNVIAEFG